MLHERAERGHPVRIALIGCGKFATMYLTQALNTRGIQIVGIADLDPGRAMRQLATAGWEAERYQARDAAEALVNGTTWLTDDAAGLIAIDELDVVVEATGIPAAGISHCRQAIAAGHHVVMVSVEADVVAGPLLAKEARAAGVVYSLAWGDQPALICEHVDWARTCGFNVVCAGKGTRYHPDYHALTPDNVWDVLREYLEIDDPGSINLKMFNSFLDGSKSGIEMSAVCNATGLAPQSDGLNFPPCSRFELADVCKPAEDGGCLTARGTTEVVSSLTRDGASVPHHLAMGTYVVIEAAGDYARQCFREYHMLQDRSGRYASLYRPTHMIGMELGVSIASAAIRGEPTGCPTGFHADVAATAKRQLKAGETLDGEGGHCVWGRQMSAADSLALGALPLGLAADVTMRHDVDAGAILTYDDVVIDASDSAVTARRQMESAFNPSHRT
jgi:predicted homoserine dehydrogenase-like protein|tara:strand:- start:101 stop:1438 length:1338 start_codon:yes stop_codon:yes gene_type:complete